MAAGGGLHGGDGVHGAPGRLPPLRQPRRRRTWRGRWCTPPGTPGRLLAVVAKVPFHRWNQDHSSEQKEKEINWWSINKISLFRTEISWVLEEFRKASWPPIFSVLDFWSFKFDQMDFYCLCSLQKFSSNKEKYPAHQTQNFKLENVKNQVQIDIIRDRNSKQSHRNKML